MAHFYWPPEGRRESVVDGVCWCPEARLFIVQAKRLLKGLERTHGPAPHDTDGLNIAGMLAAMYDGIREKGNPAEEFGFIFVREETWKKLIS